VKDRIAAGNCTATSPSVEFTPRLISLGEAVERLPISRDTAYRLIARDEFPLPLVRVGRRWFARSVDLDALVGVDGTSPLTAPPLRST